MWNPISFIAESRRVDAAELTAFALEHESKYGIIEEFGKIMVSNWYVDDLIIAFKSQQGKV